MYRILLILFLLNNTSLFSQPEGLSKKKIQENNITKASAYLDMESDDPQFENLEVRIFEFDDEARCIRKKHIRPFSDVVTTSNEELEKYDSEGNLIERISIYRNEALTEKDKEFIGLFGATNDTTIFNFKYDNLNRIIREIEFTIDTNDTLVTEYEYKDSLKTKSIHYDVNTKDELNSNNYSVEYFYDNFNRISQEKKIPKTLNQSSITSFKYLGNTLKLVEETISYDFKWMKVFKGGERSIEVSQDSINSKKTIYEYDENHNLLKRTMYRSFPKMQENFHGKKFKYLDNLLVEEQTFNNSGDVIYLIDKIKYLYDSKGFLIEEKMVYEEELAYRYKFKYE